MGSGQLSQVMQSVSRSVSAIPKLFPFFEMFTHTRSRGLDFALGIHRNMRRLKPKSKRNPLRCTRPRVSGTTASSSPQRRETW
jgi:hypothetical protein